MMKTRREEDVLSIQYTDFFFSVVKIPLIKNVIFFIYLLKTLIVVRNTRRGVSNVYLESMFWSKNKKNIIFFFFQLIIFKF